GPAPLVQPAPVVTPAALAQPPPYQAQDRPAPLSRSPIVGMVSGGRRRPGAVPGANGATAGWMVLTAKSPQAVPAGGATAPAHDGRQPPRPSPATVRGLSLTVGAGWPAAGAPGVADGRYNGVA